MSVPVERALPIAVVVAAVAVLTGSVPVVEQSRGVCGGGAVPARLLQPIYLGRGVLLKMHATNSNDCVHPSYVECESQDGEQNLPSARKTTMWRICWAAAGGG